MNEAANRWRYIGANVIPANSRQKRPIVEWKKYQTEAIPEWQHLHWIANDMFKNGLAIVLGKLWHKNPELYINGIDADNEVAIREVSTINGQVLSLDELAQEYYIEQHLDDRTRMHMVILSTAPFPKKSSDRSIPSLATKLDANEVPAIEVKTIGEIFYVSPSVHKNGFPYQVIGIDTPTVSNNFPKHIDNILRKYGIAYLGNGDNGNNGNNDSAAAAEIPIGELFTPDFKVYEGHNRHEALLRVMESLITRNRNILSSDQIKNLCHEWNNKTCDPPLDDKEFEKQWKCATKFILNNSNNGGKDNTNNNDDGGGKNKSKQVILDITDELLSRYTFKTLIDS